MSMKIQLSIPIVAGALFLSACGGEEATNSDQPKVEVTVDDQAVSADEDFILPQPISLAHAFKNAGLTYVSGKTNPISNKDKYSKKIDQLLNLGVYSTDLAYCAINNKTQEARDYLSAVQSLGTKVGLESVFSDKSLIEKFDKNLGNQSALEELIYDIQDKSDAYLQDNDLRYLAAVEFAGAWAEGMYLGIDDSRKNVKNMSIAIVDQMTLLRNTIKGLESHPSQDARLKTVIGMFRDVLTTYEGFESVKKAGKNVNFKAPELTVEEFDALSSKIVSLRNGIVSPAQK
ncbi:MAG: hypothetical protein A3D31_03570 [Candidatus Fluviicola riflensis]|nr:MAG: hypothetical protein CHH17_11460 [Candidatus Fluviicola riflensis]OGS79057.1 MAG: hypothetical protein A3D31_03570 [Candidatus Fluviicola riflensis]OGS86080.1 MAG: hypothetical protein A3E30_11060 [Fluviicola sp. RIFCSPHIGHO2_12_FULL_43_24]OGS86489.1 MAG: hypothetical protein A2724_03030 [Fluviicola sp. RIFCSPHIGHO2_01_FULL_43_53]